MNEDRQTDREIRHGGDLHRVREMGIFDDHREHDRRQYRVEPPMKATVAGRVHASGL